MIRKIDNFNSLDATFEKRDQKHFFLFSRYGINNKRGGIGGEVKW